MSYQRLLCAVDFSEASERALRRALALAREFSAELNIVHVVEHFPENLPASLGAPENEDPKSYLTNSARQRLAELIGRLGASGARQNVIVSHRSARHEIIEAARHLNADLLVVGSGPQHLLSHLGSTSSGLLHAADCDLLVVRTA